MADTPMHYMTVDEYSYDALLTMIDALQKRRLNAFVRYSATVAVKQRVQADNLLASLQKQLTSFEKDLARADTALEKLEKRLVRVQALHLEYFGMNGLNIGDNNDANSSTSA